MQAVEPVRPHQVRDWERRQGEGRAASSYPAHGRGPGPLRSTTSGEHLVPADRRQPSYTIPHDPSRYAGNGMGGMAERAGSDGWGGPGKPKPLSRGGSGARELGDMLQPPGGSPARSSCQQQTSSRNQGNNHPGA